MMFSYLIYFTNKFYKVRMFDVMYKGIVLLIRKRLISAIYDVSYYNSTWCVHHEFYSVVHDLFFYKLTPTLIPWSRIYLLEVIVAQLAKKCPAFNNLNFHYEF